MSTSKKGNLGITVILVLGSLLSAHLCVVLLPDVFRVWDAQIIDRLFLFKSHSDTYRSPYDDTIVHVDLNNSSIKELNNFYLNRSRHAQVIRNLAKMNVAAQLYDWIFAAPSSPEEDLELIDAVSDAGNVYLGLAFNLTGHNTSETKKPEQTEDDTYLSQTKWRVTVASPPDVFFVGGDSLLTFSGLASVSKGLGYLNVQWDRDGVFRRAPLLVRCQDAFYPSLPFRAICDYLNVPPEEIVVKPGKSITLKNARRPSDAAPHDIIIPIDRYGNMIINFIGPWERMKHYNYVDVLRASDQRIELEMWKEELQGKIVVISDVTTGASDVGAVPTDTNFPLSGLHANVMHTILTESFLRELSPFHMVLLELLLMSLVLGMSLLFSSVAFSFGTIGLGIGYVALAVFFFLYHHLIFHFIGPSLALTFAMISILSHRFFVEEKEKEFVRRTFETYFPPSIVKRLTANPKMIANKGEKKELTILFSDIKNFTRHSATMAPDHVRRLLNEYFEAMTEIVFRYEGTVDKYMGDGLMIFFGDPEPQPDHALRCARAAIEMQQKVKEIRKEWTSRNDMPIEIRIGINTGVVVVGNMGSPKRLSYTVLGKEANLAQRLESNAPVGGILISERTHELIKDHLTTKPLGQIMAKGFDEPVTVFEIPVT